MVLGRVPDDPWCIRSLHERTPCLGDRPGGLAAPKYPANTAGNPEAFPALVGLVAPDLLDLAGVRPRRRGTVPLLELLSVSLKFNMME